MSYLLDTNAVIAVLTGRPAAVRDRLQREMAAGGVFATSSVVLYELWYGVARSEHRGPNTERLRIFLAGEIEILHFEEEDAVIAGDLRAGLERAGTPIGPYDLLIAAQALRSGRTLITANVGEFRRVPGLEWQDWRHAD